MLKRIFFKGMIIIILVLLPVINSVAQASNTIVVRARGTSGSEQIQVEVNGSTIQTFTLSTSLSNYTASTSSSGAINVRFINDGDNRDVFVDYIDVNGERRQAENQSTNTGVWQNGACGNGSYSEWMHCNGYIGFGNTGGGSGTTTSTAGTTTSSWGWPGSTTTSTSGSQDCGTCNWYGTEYPICCNTTTGWGWENNRSCISQSTCDSQGGGTTTSTAGSTTTTSSTASTTTTSWGWPGSTTSTTTTSSASSGGNTYITQTIRVNGKTYDGNGATIHASGMGDGSQDEDQDPIFRLENATLKNVRIAAPGCDGVHCYGNCRIENVIWEDVGEDALTIKGEGTVTISGGSARDAADKVFQLNRACTFTVQNFSCTNFGCFIRQNGGTDFTCTIYIDSCTLNNGSYIGRTDAPNTRIYYRNLSVSNVSTWWRVPNSSQVQSY